MTVIPPVGVSGARGFQRRLLRLTPNESARDCTNAAMPIPPEQRLALSDMLELTLRRLTGNHFQEFFCRMMELRHPDAFMRPALEGSLGDRKCDGYLRPGHEIFQCYGAENGGAKVKAVNARLAAKIDEDYVGAAGHWPDMKVWHIVNNFILGMGTTPLARIDALQAANPHHRIAVFGWATFEAHIMSLESYQVTGLLGREVTAEDFRNIQAPEVVAVIDAIAQGTLEELPEDDERRDVPVGKLRTNGLSGAIQRKIAMGGLNERIVKREIEGHPVPLMAMTIANEFRRQYVDLDLQGLEPDDIMMKLYSNIVGHGPVAVEMDVAAWSLLSYLFVRCTIFKDKVADEGVFG
ncbi:MULTISPECIES: ABC-three component system protein [Methylobacteriaceae]|uniref:ABC-three component system protein n=1 Tax=Methylobacteriaceae TaxID=119045 RepID=UPI0011B01B2A|nr:MULTISPECIES: ABC-three component system protein [Methylobacteriaceae]MCP1549376.1 hypothetical protein [Methylorubrum zatmanii]MCP1554011.1 hypothetical protein [Methylorubrum extorquens]MCP1579678.1 hypothetical protein [Methylorubrum extorquens]